MFSLNIHLNFVAARNLYCFYLGVYFREDFINLYLYIFVCLYADDTNLLVLLTITNLIQKQNNNNQKKKKSKSNFLKAI